MNGSSPRHLIVLAALVAATALPLTGCSRPAPYAAPPYVPSPTTREHLPPAPTPEIAPATTSPTPVTAPAGEKTGSALLGDPPTMPVDVPHKLPRTGEPMPWQLKPPVYTSDGC